VTIGGVGLKITLNKILKVLCFPSCAFGDMASRWASVQTFHFLYCYLFNFNLPVRTAASLSGAHLALDPKKCADPCFM